MSATWRLGETAGASAYATSSSAIHAIELAAPRTMASRRSEALRPETEEVRAWAVRTGPQSGADRDMGPAPVGGASPSASRRTRVRALRKGRTPDRRTLDRRQMPWPDLGRRSDDELGAIHFYLQTAFRT
ncbi:MAG: hypothetical protein OHK0013_08160 [Sandaracinaceae bacterium]